MLSLLNGAWLIVDGAHVLLKGKYIGPEKPGPWAGLIRCLGLNPMKMGVPFMVIGAIWCVGAALFVMNGASVPLYVAAALTLGYVPFGTVTSSVVMGMLILR